MKKPHVGTSEMVSFMKLNVPTLVGGVPSGRAMNSGSRFSRCAKRTIASCTLFTCVATTESTSMRIRLNSSKQPHAPVCARPRKISPMVW